MSDKLDIVAIRSECGKFYLCERSNIANPHSGLSSLLNYLINGSKPTLTFQRWWVSSESEPKRITKMVRQPDTNHRYELLDKDLMSDKLPEFINRDDVAELDEDYEWVWSDRMSRYRSMYTLIFDKHPDKEEEVQFDMEIVMEAANVVEPVKMTYRIPTNRTVTENNVIYQLADKIIFPGIMLSQRPCKLTSEQSYKIVRQYIKDHIDPAMVKITSDYDFCFTVKRRIKLAKVKVFTVDVNNSIFQKRKRKPKYVEKRETEKEVACFEMTYSPENYKGYTPIEGFMANSQAELKEKIDAYCEDVTHFINAPLVECEACDGNGVIVPATRSARSK